jgi:hypothetical protein
MKYIIVLVLILSTYGGALFLKDAINKKNKNVYIPTIYELKKKNGIPVFTDEVERGKFQEFLTLSGKLQQDGTLICFAAPFISRQINVGFTAFLDLENDESRLRGIVSSVSHRPNLLNGLHEVKIQFKQRFRKERSVTVDVPFKTRAHAILVPREAISLRGPSPAAFVVKGDELVKTNVEIAAANSKEYWIKSGLLVGEMVVTSDTRYFDGGEKVKVVTEKRVDL